MMQACAVHRFPDRPDTVWALAQPLVGSMGRGLAAPSLPCCHIQRVRSLGWSWKKGWLLVLTFLLFQRGPPGGHTNRQAVVCRCLSRAGIVPTGDSHEGASLLGEKRVVPFLAEGKAKTTVLGASVPTSGGLCKSCIPWTAGSGVLWLWVCGWLQISGLVGFGR